MSSPRSIQDFIERWAPSGGAERSNYAFFLAELCEQLGVEPPQPAVQDESQNAYVVDRSVTFLNADGTKSPGFLDLYKRGCFVLETKQGVDQRGKNKVGVQAGKQRRGTAVRGTGGWDAAMLAARGQAEQYAKALPVEEGWPPFLVVVDVGFSFELYADFSLSGKAYSHFPDSRSHRIYLRDLVKEEIRERLRLVWEDPLALDPSRRSAKVTRELAEKLAALANSLEVSGHDSKRVASFLMRCIFTMFAEDVGLLRKGSFTELLTRLRDKREVFPDTIRSLWETMDAGGFSPVLMEKLLHFNGGLFENPEALPVTREQIDLLLLASQADWREVEPAIFGTLVERALDPIERHKIGAHYTPRDYVERLVLPTVIEPLYAEWKSVQVAAVTLANDGKVPAAVEEVKKFHRRLCAVRILDPACGSGNFLYVSLEHLKRLEGDVLNVLDTFGLPNLGLEEFTVDPHQLLGIEKNPWAAAIADLVLWIGYLQWHFRTHGVSMPREPVLRKFHNIECRDAVLAYDRVEEAHDPNGRTESRWDGRTFKKHPVTGEDVPDETAIVPALRYINPQPATWPAADFIVGNPPFIGNWRMRSALGDGYTEALRRTYPDIPEASEFVMYWWDHAAELVRAGQVTRFGFITTNSLSQTFNRRVVERHLTAATPLSVVFAIPDHPWVDAEEGADVRISMTVGEAGNHEGVLYRVTGERALDGEVREVDLQARAGHIHADLTIGPDVAGAMPLQSNDKLSSRGVSLHGAGFIVSPEQAQALGLGRIPGLEQHIRAYRNGRDLTATPRNVMVIDLFGLNAEEVRSQFPEVYQWVYERVKPERDLNNRETYKTNWWVFGEARGNFRPALTGLNRYISTVETAKHRAFVFQDASVLPDNMLVNIALEDAYCLGLLSSRIHVAWALAAGGRLGIGNDPRYNKTRCFDPFPFPECDEVTKDRIRAVGEVIDAHRKRQQALHPKLTLTDMYNVLEKLREGTVLTEKEKIVHQQGVVTVLRQLHDELDAAVAEAYGWPVDLTIEEILERVVALNLERAREERSGIVRWLRPSYQHPKAFRQEVLNTDEGQTLTPTPTNTAKVKWPPTLAEQAKAVREMLVTENQVITSQNLAKAFAGARVERVTELLETLVSLGQARQLEDGRYTT
jgi:hypothetical protein